MAASLQGKEGRAIDTAFFDALMAGVDKNKKIFRREFYGRLLVETVEKMVSENFAAGGRPQRWKKLAYSTARYKSLHGFPEDILVRRGGLKRAVGHSLVAKVKGNKLTFVVGTLARNLVNIHSHGLGSHGHSPARPVLQLTAAQERELERRIQELQQRAVDSVVRTARTGRVA